LAPRGPGEPILAGLLPGWPKILAIISPFKERILGASRPGSRAFSGAGFSHSTAGEAKISWEKLARVSPLYKRIFWASRPVFSTSLSPNGEGGRDVGVLRGVDERRVVVSACGAGPPDLGPRVPAASATKLPLAGLWLGGCCVYMASWLLTCCGGGLGRSRLDAPSPRSARPRWIGWPTDFRPSDSPPPETASEAGSAGRVGSMPSGSKHRRPAAAPSGSSDPCAKRFPASPAWNFMSW